MRITDYIGSSPYSEDCAQVGSKDYDTRAKKECQAFLDQIKRHYEIPAGCVLKISSNPHDFGSYYSVDLFYDVDTEIDIFLGIENDDGGHLEFWDEEAKEELGIQ